MMRYCIIPNYLSFNDKFTTKVSLRLEDLFQADFLFSSIN